MHNRRHAEPPTAPPDLRAGAERALANRQSTNTGKARAQSISALQQSLHELDVHRVELETQNEELRRLQAELEASRLRYFHLFQSAPIALLTLGKSGLIQESNAKATALLGIEGRHLKQQVLSRYVHPDSQSAYYQFQMRLKAGGTAQYCELQMISARKIAFWAHIEANAGPPELAQAESAGLRIALHDISQRRAQEEELRIAGTAFESHHGKLITNSRKEVLKLNRAFTEITGYTRQDLLGQAFDFLDPARHDPAFMEALWSSVATHGIWSGEVWSRHKYGVVRLEQLELFAVKDQQGQVSHYVANYRDLTEVESLRNSMSLWQNRFQALFENTLNCILLANDEGRYLDANPAACALLGYERRDLLTLHVTDIAVRSTEFTGQPFLWKKVIDERRHSGRMGLRHQDGHIIMVEYTAVSDIQPGIHLAVLSDITAQVQAETALLEARQRLRTFSLRQQEEFDQLRKNVAQDLHDQLGQTLSALKLEVEMARPAIPQAAAQMQELLRIAVATVRDVSRTLRPAILDLGLRAALAMLAREISMRSDVDIQIDVQQPVPSLSACNEHSLYRIAQEALSNATNHAHARKISISLRHYHDQLILQIQDDGVGFDPVANPAQAGLGLLGMEERCKLMGAGFALDTALGEGTRIRATLHAPFSEQQP